ncbi:MAG TPA: carbohydrate porin, partial [Desulfuromonadaceae bacterium]
MIRKKLVLCLLLATCLTLALSATSFALHPELQIPEKVEMKHEACQALSAIAKKYSIEGMFPKDFEEGKQHLNRVELAASVELLTEKLAEKVVKEGSASVDRKDLQTLDEIREDLRAEMLLVHTRAFQQRNETLGTLLHPLTSTISLSGQMVGVFQSSVGLKPRNHSAVVGRGDLVFSFKISDTTTAVIDVEATGGDGLDPRIPNFSGLNGVAGSTKDRVRFRQAWVEQSLFSDRMLATVGKIDLANYFDANAVANDENSQFLSSAFVNAHALSLPEKGPGARMQFKLAEPLVFGLGYGAGNVDADGVPTGDDILDHGFGIAELDYKLKMNDLEGNYRVYGALDGALPDNVIKLKQKNAYNYGFSIDQQLTGKLSIFGRYAQRERSIYLTNRSWSAGLQYTGLIPGRADDVTAVAYGQISGNGLPAQEKLLEWYYKFKV